MQILVYSFTIYVPRYGVFPTFGPGQMESDAYDPVEQFPKAGWKIDMGLVCSLNWMKVKDTGRMDSRPSLY